MSKSTSVRLDNDHERAIEQMVKNGDADSPTEALRQTSQAELARRGYLTGNGPSTIAWVLDRVGFASGIVGIVWVAFTFLYPVEVRLYSVAFLLASFLAYSTKWVVESNSQRSVLSRVFSRRERV